MGIIEGRFPVKVFKMLLRKGKITQDLVNPASAGENLARYIIRASFSQERMTYFQEESKVVYQSKDGKAARHIRLPKHLKKYEIGLPKRETLRSSTERFWVKSFQVQNNRIV